MFTNFSCFKEHLTKYTESTHKIYVGNLGSILTNDGRCTCEIKPRIAMAKAAFNKKKTLFTNKLDLNLRNKLVKCFVRC
jgi:hypothetical protein